MKLTKDCEDNLYSFAYSCTGYVGADIEMICKSAIFETIQNNSILLYI